MTATGWFADIDEETSTPSGHPGRRSTKPPQWQPVLQLDGRCLPLDGIWSETEAQCLDFIRANILGQGMHPDVAESEAR